jgi:zinc transport system substrate-binding protein
VQSRALAIAVALVGALPANADAPRVATDIPPVHSLAARVMEGLAEPQLILPPGASPHGYAMRPSEAATLADADVVIWMGESLTPWLGRAVDALAPEARSLELLETDGTLLLGYREGAAFGQHDHAEQHDRDGHAQGKGNGVGEIDPHAWLDPENAKTWLGAIAEALAAADPANAAAYAANAAEGRAELDALGRELARTLEPVRGAPFIVFHDAYHYFEHRLGPEAAGAISLGDASASSAARLAEIRATIRRTGALCVFAEPQFAPELIDTVIEGTDARPAMLDPLGATLEPGPELYPRLMRGLAENLRSCLDPAG